MAAGWLELTFYSEAVAVLSLSVCTFRLDTESRRQARNRQLLS